MRWLVPMVLGLLLVAACGGSDDAPVAVPEQTPAPAPTPVDTDAPEDAGDDLVPTPEIEVSGVADVVSVTIAGDSVYTVEPGDFLAAIAERLGVTVTELVEANNIANPEIIAVGDELVIPGREETSEIVPSAPERVDLVAVELARVIDGDTISVRLPDGSTDTIRYIGIDTPESAAPGQPVEPFALAASARNEELLRAGPLFVTADITDRDRFDRLLRYVWVEQPTGGLLLVNLALVAEGYAAVSTFPPDVRHVDTFVTAQDAAQAVRLGMWGP